MVQELQTFENLLTKINTMTDTILEQALSPRAREIKELQNKEQQEYQERHKVSNKKIIKSKKRKVEGNHINDNNPIDILE